MDSTRIFCVAIAKGFLGELEKFLQRFEILNTDPENRSNAKDDSLMQKICKIKDIEKLKMVLVPLKKGNLHGIIFFNF